MQDVLDTQLSIIGRISAKWDYVHYDMNPETHKNVCLTGLTS